MRQWLSEAGRALRGLRTARGPALIAVITLGLGVAAVATVFAVVNGAWRSPYPWPESDRLVRLFSSLPESQLDFFSVSPMDLEDWRAENRAFEAMAGYDRQRTIVLRVNGGEPQEAMAARAEHRLWPLLGTQAAAGRMFGKDEDRADGEPVAVVTYGFWQNELGARADLSNVQLQVNGVTHAVVGVLPRTFAIPGNPAEIWTPLAPELASREPDRRARFLRVLGRMRAGVTVDAAMADMRRVTGRLAEAYPATNRGWSVSMMELETMLVGESFRRAMVLLLGVAGLVLLIAGANVTNLLMVRGIGRRLDSATRMALGASRRRLVQAMLVEGGAIGVLAGALGVLLATWGVALLRAVDAGAIPRMDQVGVTMPVALMALALALAAGVALSIGPAFQATAVESGLLVPNTGRLVTTGRSARRVRGGLLVGQVALTMMLLVGAGLMLRSFQRLLGVETGFTAEGVLTARVSLPEVASAELERVRTFYDALLERARGLPGVVQAALVTQAPMSGPNSSNVFLPEGMTRTDGPPPDADYRYVTPDYFALLDIPLLQGRTFREAELREGGVNALIVSETMARRYWPDGALGARVRVGDVENGPWLEIVGVVADARYQSLETPEIRPMMYLPHRTVPAMTLLLRTEGGEPAALAPAVRSLVRSLDPTLAPGAIAPLAELKDSAYAARRFQLVVFGVFGLLALVLAAVGTYSVIAFAVAQRTAEFGIRAALGAVAARLLGMVLLEGLTLAAAGLVLGAVASLNLTGLMRSLLFETSPTDVFAFAGVAALLLFAMLAACVVPAIRAMRVSPIVAMKHETH